MPNRLPTDFFIPDADYDAATRDTGEQETRGPARGLNIDKPVVSPFFKEVDGILHSAGISGAALDAVRAAMQKELDTLSDEVADRVRRG